MKLNRFFVLAVLFLVFVVSVIVPVNAATITVDTNGNGDYTSIQAGVDAASTGDTILVYPGTYYESVDVNKKLNITSINGTSMTMVDSIGIEDHTFDITVDEVNISGLEISSDYYFACIYLNSSDNIVMNNKLSHDIFGTYGIFLQNSKSNIIKENSILSYEYGIYLNRSSENELMNNTLSSFMLCDIYLISSSNNSVLYNKFISRKYMSSYICLSSSDENQIIGNVGTSNYNCNSCISLGSSNNNTLYDNHVTRSARYGIVLSSSDNNNITKNDASSAESKCIYLSSSNNNTLEGNIASNTGDSGILIGSSRDNLFMNNIVSNHRDTGFILRSSRNNTFVNNIVAGTEECSIWLSSSDNNSFVRNSISNNGRAMAGFMLKESNFTHILANNISIHPYGIWLDSSHYNNINDNTIESSTFTAFKLHLSTNNTLANNTLTNSPKGIWLSSADNNLIYNNLFNNSENLLLSGECTGNIWNISKTPGENIIGGPYLGGNYWSKPDGSGFSETNATDFNNDGISDIPYVLSQNNIDHLPLVVSEDFSDWALKEYDVAKTHFYPYPTQFSINPCLYNELWNISGNNEVRIADLDGDSFKEVICTNGQTLSVYNYEGQEQWSIPTDSRLDLIADVTGDSNPEIITDKKGSNSLYLYIYDNSGSLLKTLSRPGGSDSAIVALLAEDVDNDGNKEVLAHLDSGYSRDPRGAALFDYETGAELWYYDIGPAGWATTIGDIDNDGICDVVRGGGSWHNGGSGSGVNGAATTTTDGDIYTIAFRADTGEEIFTNNYFSDGQSNGFVDHSIVNLDNTGNKILAFEGHSYYYPGTVQVHLIDQNGVVLRTWSGPYVSSTDSHEAEKAIADFDHDGYDEIVVKFAGVDSLTMLDHNLNPITQVPLSCEIEGLIANDVDGDGDIEILVADETQDKLRIFDNKLNEKCSYDVADIHCVYTADLDNDGINEIITTSGDFARIFRHGKQDDPLQNQVPEFPSIAFPVIAIIGITLFLRRNK